MAAIEVEAQRKHATPATRATHAQMTWQSLQKMNAKTIIAGVIIKLNRPRDANRAMQ